MKSTSRAAQQPIQPETSQRKARLYNPDPHLPSTLFRSPPSPISTTAPPVAAADLAASPTGARRTTARQAEMATGNKFQVLAGLDDDDNKFDDESEAGDFDEADIGAFGVLANNLQDLDLPVGALPPAALLPVVQIAPILAPAAVLPGVQIAPILAPAAVLPGVQIGPALPPAAVLPGVQIAPALPPAALAPDQHPIHEDDGEKNPWIHVGPRRNLRNPDSPRQEYCLDPEEEKVCDEVLWVAKTGSLRRIKKHAQARKVGYVPIENGAGTYVYGTYGPDGLES